LLVSPSAVSGDGLSRDTQETTWSISPQWFLTDDTMLFLTRSHGFKSGGFNTGFGSVPIADREFDDEDIDHLEAGFKSRLLDGRMYLAGSAFATDYGNYQDAAFVGLQFTVGNAQKAELRGAELEGQWLLSESLTAEFAISFANLEYARNTSGVCYPGRSPDSPTTPGACVLDGEKPVNAPEWKTYLAFHYDRPVHWGDLYVRGAWSWTDEYSTSFSADPRLIQAPHSWVSLRAGARRGRYELVAWVDNLLDETVVDFDSVFNLYVGDGSYQSFLQAPRSWGLTLRIDY
jgi:iron complex outermembrane receptor protein